MASSVDSLRRELRHAGITAHAIDAVWPEWWSTDAESSLSAVAELRYTVARRLGMSARSLFDGPPKFVWKDEAKFKNLGTATEREAAILTSFGVAVGRYSVAATALSGSLPRSPTMLRESILESAPVVGLGELLAFSWAAGIPVIQLRLFPLRQKRMQAIAVRVGERYAVLIGRESKFHAQVAYILAHEIGHIVLDHVSGIAALLDVDDPLKLETSDEEEQSADRFALELLTGDPEPRVEATVERFSARQLAEAALRTGPYERVEPGVLALCLAHATGRWRQGFGALKLIPPGEEDVGSQINDLALAQLDLESLPLDGREYLHKVTGSRG
jgi:hypothetical protein